MNNGSLQIRGGNSFSSGSSNTGGTRMLLFGHEHDNHAKQFYVDSALHQFSTYDAKNLFVINENARIYAPRTTNANINDQGDQSIITKKYLESVFNLDGGVLTIDLDPADPT